MYRYEIWTVKKGKHWIINAFKLWMLEKTLENPLDCKEIKPVNHKGNPPWIFIEKTVTETVAVRTLLSTAGDAVLYPGQGPKIPHAMWPKKKKAIEQKQYYKNSKKTLKMIHINKKEWMFRVRIGGSINQ